MHIQYKYKNQDITSLPILLRNPKILIIGGGNVALEKAIVLKKNNINFRIISQDVASEVFQYCNNIQQREFRISDLRKAEIVIDATGNDKVRNILFEEKGKRNFLLNRVDQPEDCDFYFSSLLQYNNLKIAISSDGASPKLTQLVRDKIKNIIPPEISELAVKKQKERNNKIIETESISKIVNDIFGKVSIVGCGPGDPGLLTLKAYRAIKNADVVLTDNLISDGIISLIPNNTTVIYVGKEFGKPSIFQEEINHLLLDEARKGKRVIRLKGGDPYIFGRGAEEAEFLINNDISVEIIPGLTSALTGPASVGIPPTARNYSTGLTIVSCSLKDGKSNLDWIELLKNINHTVVVLMGLHKADEIVKEAFKIGIDCKTDVAIISNATTPKQKIIKTTLDNFLISAITAERPALLVFGKVLDYTDILPKYNYSDLNINLEDELNSLIDEKRVIQFDQIQ